MLRANPDAAMEVIRYLGNRLNEVRKGKVLALDRADQRLASLLVNLAERSGIRTQQEFSDRSSDASGYGEYGRRDH